MNLKNLTIAAAVGSLLTAGAAGTAAAGDADPKVMCYGVAKAGKNDCSTNAHSCAGQATKDNDPAEWVQLPKSQCEKMGGKFEAPKQK